MNILRRSCVVVFIILTLFSGLSMAASDKKKEVKKKGVEKKYYFYDKVTDAYIHQIMDQVDTFFKKDEYDKAIALLVKEQARLDKKGRKVNRNGRFVKTPEGGIRKLKDGQESDLPEATDEEVPRLPSPLIITLKTIRMSDGQCPLEMVDYYQEYAKKFKTDSHCIFAASQAVSLGGFNNEKSWEFVNATFDQMEKNQLSECLLEQHLAGEFRHETVDIILNELAKYPSKSITLSPQSYKNIIKAVIDNKGDIRYIPFSGKTIAYINMADIQRIIRQNNKMRLKEKAITEVIIDATELSSRGRYAMKSGKKDQLPITFESYEYIATNLRSMGFSVTSFIPKTRNLIVDVKKLKRENNKPGGPPTTNDIKYALTELSKDVVPENIKCYFSGLSGSSLDRVEALFWDSCPQWNEFNLENRLVKAKQLRRDDKYTSACELYELVLGRYGNQIEIFNMVQANCIESQFEQALWHRNHRQYAQALEVYGRILKRYQKQDGIPERVQYACLESRVEEVLLSDKNYKKYTSILGDYKELLEQESGYNQRANSIKVLCEIFLGNHAEAQNLIKDKVLSSQIFSENRVLSLLSAKQRMIFDDYVWENCIEWKDYNLQRQFAYAQQRSRDGKYSDSIVFFDRLHKRYNEMLSQEMILSYLKTAIRAEKMELALSLLKECDDLGETERMIAFDILWLLQTGKAHSVANLLNSFKALLGEGRSLGSEMKFYLAYSLVLEGKHEEGQRVLTEMKKDYPENLYTLKMSYLAQQKERLESAFEFTQKDQFGGLINKAGNCFDEGDLEMALGIYLRIFAEYADRQEESSRACYLLGYYYLLSGDFDAANNILVFLQKEYKTTAYAKEADVLIQRIKEFTAS